MAARAAERQQRGTAKETRKLWRFAKSLAGLFSTNSRPHFLLRRSMKEGRHANTMVYSDMQRLFFTTCSLLGSASAFSDGASICELGRCRLRMNAPLHVHVRDVRPIGRTDGSSKRIGIGALHLSSSANTNDGVDFDSLLDMDVVLFKRKNSEKEELELGAMQEDGTVAPISAWSLESAFASGSSDSIEFLVDEEDRFPGLTADDVVIVSVVDESLISYGSRQVGGGKGPGNPHGEESELLYYVERSVIEEDDVEVVIKPELEILW